MTSLLERKLLVVTGKGGVGKTTVAAALGLLAAERGARTIVVEVGDQARLPELFGIAGRPAGRGDRARTAPVEHLDRPRPRPARVAAETRRSRVGPRARLQQHLPVLCRRGPGRQGAREHGQDLGAHAGPALAQGRGRLRPRGARRSGDRPCARHAPLAFRHSARSRASGRSPGSQSRCESCSRTPPAPASWPWRRQRRWPSPRRSSSSDDLHRAPRPRPRGGRRQRDPAATLHRGGAGADRS